MKPLKYRRNYLKCKLNRNRNNISSKMMSGNYQNVQEQQILGYMEYLYVKVYYILTLNDFLMTL